MTTEQSTQILLAIIIVGLAIIASLFAMIAVAGRILTKKSDRSRLGTSVGITGAAVSVFFASLAPFFFNRMVNGEGHELGNPAALVLRLLLAVSIISATISASIAIPEIVRRFRDGGWVIAEDGVFATLARAMPIIVSNHMGVIQYTTPAFDELGLFKPKELVGKDLKTIMPDRYKGRHDGGMQHYIQTREKRIVGKVVTVEMLRGDGTEVPVYLALTTADIEGCPWFVAALWQKEPHHPDQIIVGTSDLERS